MWFQYKYVLKLMETVPGVGDELENVLSPGPVRETGSGMVL